MAQVEREFKAFRSSMLLGWIISNSLYTYVIAGQVRPESVSPSMRIR